MFNSPLQPKPLPPLSGAADPFARGPMPPPQAAPAGEFTRLFGRNDLGSTPVPPAAPNRAPTADGATGLFKATPPNSYPPAPGPANIGYKPSSGAGEFTSMMAAPAMPLLADAGSAPPAEQKSFLQKHLSIIIIIGALLVFFVLIVIFFAMRKH